MCTGAAGVDTVLSIVFREIVRYDDISGAPATGVVNPGRPRRTDDRRELRSDSALCHRGSVRCHYADRSGTRVSCLSQCPQYL